VAVRPNASTTPPRQVVFEATPEIFASDTSGGFSFPLVVDGKAYLETAAYDEMRFVFSVWHPSNQRSIDLDRAYVELRASFEAEHEHFTKIAEIEPVVPAYGGGETFDGWIVLPILGPIGAFLLVGSGFDPRARIQVRASAYFVP
jgi:hypothetical protein